MNQKLSLAPESFRSADLGSRLAQLAAGGADAIKARLQEIEGEWSAGRVAKAVLSVTILIGVLLATTLNAWWTILPVVAGLLLCQYFFMKTSVLVLVTRYIGFRTRAEIEHEKFALRTIRGDFRNLPTLLDIEDTDDITRLEGEGGIVRDDDERKLDSRDAVKEILHAAKKEETAVHPVPTP